MPSGTAPRKAAAKLRHFHETSKSFADFYLFLPKIGVVKAIMSSYKHQEREDTGMQITSMFFQTADYESGEVESIGAQASRSQTVSSASRCGERVSNTC